jgi:nucleotide-binding universal stress UspA family protein
MHIVVCLDFEDGFAPIEAFPKLVPFGASTVELLHVVDAGERRELEGALHPGLVRPHPQEAELRSQRSERKAVEAVAERAAQALGRGGARKVTLTTLEGRPEREIVARLQDSRADVCVIARRPDWQETASSGPRSVGHVARFVLDHAPCAVLLLR